MAQPEHIAEALVEESQHYPANNRNPDHHDNTTTMVISITPEKSCTFGLADGHGSKNEYGPNPVSTLAVTDMIKQLSLTLGQKINIEITHEIAPSTGAAPQKLAPPPIQPASEESSESEEPEEQSPDEQYSSDSEELDTENPIISLLGDEGTISKITINDAFSGKNYNPLEKAEFLERAFIHLRDYGLILYPNDDRSFFQKRASRYDDSIYTNLQFKHIGILKNALLELAEKNVTSDITQSNLEDYILDEQRELAKFRRGHSVSQKQFDNGEAKTLTKLIKIFNQPENTGGCKLT